ncbi:MAG: hypothetical protein KDI44_15885 [Thiothrix sp.]|nr:hypothetical protein [Thiothrix sp.]HPQ95783.1 hypothetical protein [Thiolinea sp.]
MRFNQSLLPAVGLVAASLLSGNALAANCSISYYCYQTMTPDKETQARQVELNRRILSRSSQQVQRQNNPQPTATRVARQQPAQATQAQQQRLARQRAEQQRQQQLARQRAEQQRQQQLARQRAEQPRTTTPPANPISQAQRQAAMERARRQQQAAASASRQPTAREVERTIPTRFTPDNIERTTESCDVLKRKIQELNRQAVLESQNQSRDAAVRLFRVVAQLTSEGKKQNCSGL